VKEIDGLLNGKSHQAIVKLSPMLDISASIRALSNVSDVYVIAIQNEVKELLLRKSQSEMGIQIHAINHRASGEVETFSFFAEEEAEANVVLASKIRRFLFEPNASLLKAGAYRLVSLRFELEKLHLSSHLYTSEVVPNQFPGRIFEVVDCFSFSNSEIKRLHTITRKANISVRNFPSTVDALRKKLKLADGGDFYLFATTFADNQKRMILARKAR
jgi:hypothetical protein